MTIKISEDKLKTYSSSQLKVFNYIKKNNRFKSYDQADYKVHKSIIDLLKKVRSGSLISKIQLKIIYAYFYFAPLAARKRYGIKPDILSGGVAFLLSAIVELIDNNSSVSLLSSENLLNFRDETAKMMRSLSICSMISLTISILS